VLQALPEEQRPIAELALQGMAAVRQRLREDNQRLKAEGKATMPEGTVLKLAEELLPKLRAAEWLDRAEAARDQLEHLDLRDLRSVVAAADDPMVARDEATRAIADELKVALTTKQEQELQLWLGDIDAALGVGRVIRALRLSSQPPKAGVPFPAELAQRLTDGANASLTPDDGTERWCAVLEAAAFSPIRTHVAPSGIPATVADELRATVTRLAPALPQVAALFGIEVPANAPMPKPLRPTPRPKPAKAGGAAKPAAKPAPAKAEAPAAPPPEAGPSEPTPAEPESAEPAEPEPESPASSEPTPAEPESAEPAEPASPESSEQTPAEPESPESSEPEPDEPQREPDSTAPEPAEPPDEEAEEHIEADPAVGDVPPV
jgi:hypothetical protein